jgi:competence protein ComEC
MLERGHRRIEVDAHARDRVCPVAAEESVGLVMMLADRWVTLIAAATALAVWSRSVPTALVLAGAVAGFAAVVAPPRATVVTVSVLLVLPIAAIRSQQAWAGLNPDELGAHLGWVRVVDDPQPYAGSTRVIVEIDGERFEIWSRGRAQQQRIRRWRGGQWLLLSGDRIELDDERSGRVAWQHVVGELRLDWVGDTDEGGPVARASNRVRAAIERAATHLPADDGALYRGLVVGDDRDQPQQMITRFRASGLSHLTAVSGQNVAFVLAACGPLLRRLRPVGRWALTLGLIAWFVTLTRFEPSIVRAGTMAALSATAYATGRERTPLRILALAVVGLVLVDPLLVWSVGFWLSVGATAGVTTAGPWLAARLAFCGPAALPLGITLGAQLGVVVPSVLVFGRLPLVSVPANLLAVPVAGAVMLYGLPAGLLAGVAPPLAPVVMLPVRLGTRWVDSVALLAARAEPSGAWPWVGWAVVVGAIGAALLVVGARGASRDERDERDVRDIRDS